MKRIFITERMNNGKSEAGPRIFADDWEEAKLICDNALPEGTEVIGQLVLPWWRLAWCNILHKINGSIG